MTKKCQERRDNLMRYIEAYTCGDEPSPLKMLRAARIENWEAVVRCRGKELVLVVRGNASKHPEIQDGDVIQTSAVTWFDRKNRFIRTLNHIFALGQPAESRRMTAAAVKLVEAHVVVGTLVIVVARRGWTRPALIAVQQRTAEGAPVEIMTERQWRARVDLVRRPGETDEQYLRRLAAESGEEVSMMTRVPISGAIERLLERLQTGWAPKATEIDRAVPQVDALNWEWNFEDSMVIVPLGIIYQTAERVSGNA